MRMFIISLSSWILLTFSVQAHTYSCGNSVVSITSPNLDYATMACQAARRAQSLFEACNVPPLSRPISLHIVRELPPGFAGLYHRGKDWIEVLAPPMMETVSFAEGAFGFLKVDAYFQSVIVHELSHAAYEAVPCPFASCVTSNAYVAYSMQVMSLAPNSRSVFEEKAALDRPVSREEFSSTFLFMAPSRFAQKAWTHLSQRDDPCGYIGQITDGTILLDRERF